MTTQRFGVHCAQEDLFDEVKALGADAVQIFLGDPQSWKKPEVVVHGGAAGLRAAAEAADVDVYVHAPYVINVASTNNRIRIPSRKLLQQVVTLAGEVGAKGVVVHGGHVTKDEDPQLGIDNWRKAMERLEPGAPVLIENTAGGTRAMTRTLDMIERLFAALDGLGAGFCLDTCHAWAAGLDLDTVVEDVLAATGRIDLVHANDSRGEAGSGQDRHANLGHGTIGGERIAAILTASGAPAVLETAPAGQRDDLDFLRAHV